MMHKPDVNPDGQSGCLYGYRKAPAGREKKQDKLFFTFSGMEYLMTSSDGIDKCEITITEDLGVFIYLFRRN